MHQDGTKREDGRRRRRVIIHHKVTASEWEQHRERMEGLGLDPTEPIPAGMSASAGGDPFDGAPVYAELMKPPPAAPPASSGGLGLPAVSPRESAAKPTNVLGGRTGRAPLKQASLQKRTLEEQIQSERHERALARWAEQQAHWERFRHVASEMTGRKKEELVVTRAEEHRERLEVFELLDRATPDEVKSGGHSWYHSLRGDGTRFIQVGNMFSGLYLPIKLHKENYVHEIVRKPLLRELHERRIAAQNNEEGIQKTWRDDEFLGVRLRRYAKKMAELAPGQLGFHETLEPEGLCLNGKRLQTITTPDKSASDVGVVVGDEDERPGGEDNTVLQSVLKNIVEKPRGSGMTPPALIGPHIKVSLSKLQFRTTVGTSCTISVTLKNIGTASVDYEWKQNQPQHGFQESILPDDPVVRFSCEVTRGTILPEREKHTIFTFVSHTPGTFTSSWSLRTYPELVDAITHIPMSGIAMEADLLEERRGIFKKTVFEQQILHQVQEVIEDIVDAVQLRPQEKLDLNLASVQERLFSERNGGKGLYWSPHAWERLTSLRERVEILKLKTSVGSSTTGSRRVADDGGKPVGDRPLRGRVPFKKPDPGPPPRPPEEMAPSPEEMLAMLSKIETVARGAISEATPPEIELFNEKQEISVQIPRAVRGAKVRPPERSPIWWAAYELVTELALSVPRFAGHARKYTGLEPLRPFVTPPHVDVIGEEADEFEARMEARRRDKDSEELREKEAKATEHFFKTFTKSRFGPGVLKFAGLAREATMVSSVRRAASSYSTAQERLAPYVNKQNNDGIEMSGSVVIYEADLGFLAPMMLGANENNPRPEEIKALPPPEAMDMAKARLQGLQSVLEANPLAVLVVAHVGVPLPDVAPDPASVAASGAEEEEAAQGDEDEVQRRMRSIRKKDEEWLSAVTQRMSGLISLEPLLDSVREASEPAATVVEFVPHETWLGDIEAFAAKVRNDEKENKVFFLENLSAIPEEVGLLRIIQPPPKVEEKVVTEPDPKAKAKAKAKAKEEVTEEIQAEPVEPPAPDVVRLPWTRRECWAERTFRALQPEVLVLDAFEAGCQDFTLHTGVWPGAPLRVIGPSIDTELTQLQEVMPTLGREEAEGDEAAAKGNNAEDEEEAQSNAPMMLAIGGGGFGFAGGSDALLRKLQLLVGISQVAPLERSGVVVALGGELSICVLADILGLDLGIRAWRPNPSELSAVRVALLDVLARPGVQVLLPRDLVCEDLGGQAPLPRISSGSRSQSPTQAASAPVAGDTDAQAESKLRNSVSLASALSVVARRPVSLGTRNGREQCVVVDAITGMLSLVAGSPEEVAAAVVTETDVASGLGAVPLAEVPEDPAEAEAARAEAESAALKPVAPGSQACDIGDETVEALILKLKRCRGMVWNGAMGIWECEDERFQYGTRALLAAVEQRLMGGEEEEEDEEDEEDEDEDEDEDDPDGGGKPRKEKPEPDAEFEVALVIGRDSTQRLTSLLETPSVISFISQSGEALLNMFRGEPLPGILACTDRASDR